MATYCARYLARNRIELYKILAGPELFESNDYYFTGVL